MRFGSLASPVGALVKLGIFPQLTQAHALTCSSGTLFNFTGVKSLYFAKWLCEILKFFAQVGPELLLSRTLASDVSFDSIYIPIYLSWPVWVRPTAYNAPITSYFFAQRRGEPHKG